MENACDKHTEVIITIVHLYILYWFNKSVLNEMYNYIMCKLWNIFKHMLSCLDYPRFNVNINMGVF